MRGSEEGGEHFLEQDEILAKRGSTLQLFFALSKKIAARAGNKATVTACTCTKGKNLSFWSQTKHKN